MDISERALKAARLSLHNYMLRPDIRRIWCYTDTKRQHLARGYAAAAAERNIPFFMTVLTSENYSEDDLSLLADSLGMLTPEDLVLSLFSSGNERNVPYFKVFPNLRQPQGFSGYSAVIRQRYNEAALLEHLCTAPESVAGVVDSYSEIANKKVRVTAPGGTDMTLELMAGFVLPYTVNAPQRHAYLPPAELTFGVVPGSAQGRMVIDVTAGELAVHGQLVDTLGLVDEPIHLEVANGLVTSISGGTIAARLSRHLFGLEPANRVVVELGLGLSQGTPTGEIGPDECLQGTCHFGIGDDFFYGGTNKAALHLDLVLRHPQITVQG